MRNYRDKLLCKKGSVSKHSKFIRNQMFRVHISAIQGRAEIKRGLKSQMIQSTKSNLLRISFFSQNFRPLRKKHFRNSNTITAFSSIRNLKQLQIITQTALRNRSDERGPQTPKNLGHKNNLFRGLRKTSAKKKRKRSDIQGRS